MSNRLAIACDIDGVLADFEGEFVSSFGSNNREFYNLFERYPEHADLIGEFVRNPTNYVDLEPIFGGLSLVHSAALRGMDAILMTSRPTNCREATEEWLDRYSVNYKSLIFTKNKADTIKKLNSLPGGRIFMLLDDSIGNLEHLPMGVSGVAWSQLWNFGHFPRMRYDDGTMQVQIKRDTVSDWESFWKD